MLKFLIGVIVGGIIGFLVCAVLSINSAEKESKHPPTSAKKQENPMPETNPDSELYLLIGVVVVVILLPMLIGLVVFINDFSSELRYLNNEIGRTTGGERRY